ncbi:acyl-CoA dehydrogenase family protein [Ferrovibrio sp.]|uniref:acyl-CoA dehydrogenase family protein n=1 Tax=Ferrovibrio sp. TaxID=1917215 RepID=UPI003D287AC2
MNEANELSAIVTEQAGRLLQQRVTKEVLLAADQGEWQAGLWREVEKAGLPLALLSEAAGGVGLGAVDALGLVRQAGYHALPLPLPEHMLAARLWCEAGGDLPDGVITLAPETLGLTQGCIQGDAKRVPWGAVADHILLLLRDAAGALHLALLPKGVAKAQSRRNVAYEPRDTLLCDGLAVKTLPAPAAIGADGLLPLGALLRAQQMVGAMERALDHGLDYANERVQFGRAIGKFQAVQHMLAVAAGHLAAATAAADLAVKAWDSDGFGFAIAVAKARVGEAAGEVAAISHQVHGAMGFTQEHPLHFATRRLWSWRDEFGNESLWQQRLGELVCAQGGEKLWSLLTAT